jgi:enoyl-CoA hydratase/carnithine racemase
MILLAERIDGAKMLELGIACSMVAPTELVAAGSALAERLAAGPPLAFAEIKKSVYASWGDIEEALRREREGQLRLLRSKDAMEGVMAFFQKRAPSFSGQ